MDWETHQEIEEFSDGDETQKTSNIVGLDPLSEHGKISIKGTEDSL